MKSIVYCIECERNVLLQHSKYGDYHEYFTAYIGDDGRLEIDWCSFPLGYLEEEPWFPYNWEELVEEPSPDELEMMNKYADEMFL